VTPPHIAGTPPANWALAPTARGALDHLRIMLERLVRREHVVVGRDDGEGGSALLADRELVVDR
jgi:hypothetical protein